MKLSDYCFTGNKKVDLKKQPTDSKKDKSTKQEILNLTLQNQNKMKELQQRLYADGREGVIFVLQAMDAAGKDSTIRHVMGPLNPQGVEVTSFKQPGAAELAHDYLWRAHSAVPYRGNIGIFNRSYYEDVLVVKVHDLQNRYKIANRCLDKNSEEFFEKRYRQIRDFEEYLYENSYKVVKIFLHVSKGEQKKRFLERIDDETKNWKFSSSDLKERAYFDKYMSAYEEAIHQTATKNAPWYVLPAYQKWYTRYLVSEIVVKTLSECKPEYPELSSLEIEALHSCKAQLLAENGGGVANKKQKAEPKTTKTVKQSKAKNKGAQKK